MSETAVIEQTEELAAALSKRRREQNEQQKTQDEQEQKLKKKLRIRLIAMVVLVLCILLIGILKYFKYFRPEKVKYDSSVQMISAVNPNTENLQVMPFNEELIAACQPILIADSRDNSLQFDFISPEQNRVLIRAEIFTDKQNVKQKSFRMFWTNLFQPDDESMVRIGATGWVRPGEMIGKMKLDALPIRMSDVTLRFSAVNPANENISAGVFTMNTVLHVVDFQGKMLDENGNWVNAG